MKQLKETLELEIAKYDNANLFFYTNLESIDYDYERIEYISRFYSTDSIKVKLLGHKNMFVISLKDIYIEN